MCSKRSYLEVGNVGDIKLINCVHKEFDALALFQPREERQPPDRLVSAHKLHKSGLSPGVLEV